MTAGAEAATVDERPWVPAVAAPIACLAIDLVAGGHIVKLAPVALPSLAAIGIASFLISRNQRRTLVGQAAVGPLWLVAGLALLVGSALAALTALGLIGALLAGALGLGAPGFKEWLLRLLHWLILGFGPLWTGIAYLREVRELTDAQIAAFGTRRTGLAALAGMAVASAVVGVALILDSRLAHVSCRLPP
jgi:hypothetical protein